MNKIVKSGVIGLSVILFLFIGLMLYHSFYVVEEVHVLEADVYISENTVGFNVDRDALHFGVVPWNKSGSIKTVEIKNERDYPVKVVVSGKGELKKWVFSYLKSNQEKKGPTFYFEPGESKLIAFGVRPGEEAEVGKQYKGGVKITVMKTKWF